MKLLLHVCCGPCSLEPYRILNEQGYDITLHYSNDNIYPEDEFNKREDTLLKWAKANNIQVITDTYNHESWKNNVQTRCTDCYAHRLESSAKYASEHDYDALSTSLAVSPYQQTETIKQVLIDTCKEYDLIPVFIDFRPYYRDATKRSIELGMYHQKYCGCEYSLKERKEQVALKQANIAKQKMLHEASKKKKQDLQKLKERHHKLKEQYRNQVQQ